MNIPANLFKNSVPLAAKGKEEQISELVIRHVREKLKEELRKNPAIKPNVLNEIHGKVRKHFENLTEAQLFNAYLETFGKKVK